MVISQIAILNKTASPAPNDVLKEVVTCLFHDGTLDRFSTVNLFAGSIPAPASLTEHYVRNSTTLQRVLYQSSRSTGDGLCAQQFSVKDEAYDEQNYGKHH